ncbi:MULTISPECIES: PilN domain-containing protein [unclassified Pseudoalteromonas]|uniref:PilN domain-containing protein n=1 Tax=unclassified Pseudoalteromonas TaxID=194690 RepID=UPI001E58340F|nr:MULTISPECIES: PilN domain-containing protein [unclassified Pseudoalteromonas]MDN3475623.1 PilN domain-containing protein [Pseudoalteromonas sp. APC 3355]|tara:strand:- start:305 stop:904 length:600 start_codon:yes stop_codon:yes gene_type:complete
MKTRINFYHKTLRVRRDPVPLSGMITLWLGALLIIAITWAFYSYKTYSNKLDLEQNKEYLKQGKAQLEVVKQQLAEKQNKALFINELKTLQQEVLHKQQIFTYLELSTDQSTTDYAQVMQDLAKYHEPNIWLTHIKFAGKSVTLQGQVSQSKFLPIWFSNLKQSSFFIDKEFSVLELSTQDGVSKFNVATDLSDEGDRP